MDATEWAQLKQKAVEKNYSLLYGTMESYEKTEDVGTFVRAMEALSEMDKRTMEELKKAHQLARIPSLSPHLFENLHTQTAGEMTDGSHTFDELYYHRMVLFAALTKAHKERAWKSWKHEDGTMFDNFFIVGVTINNIGDFSYHYHKDHWDAFEVKELPTAPKFDGHTSKDVERLLSL